MHSAEDRNSRRRMLLESVFPGAVFRNVPNPANRWHGSRCNLVPPAIGCAVPIDGNAGLQIVLPPKGTRREEAGTGLGLITVARLVLILHVRAREQPRLEILAARQFAGLSPSVRFQQHHESHCLVLFYSSVCGRF